MNYLAVTVDYATWWYSGGIIRLFRWIRALFGWLNNFFSINRVLKTLFAPWKRLVEDKRPGLDGFRDWLIDNFVSRLVGFFMRVFIIFAYFITIILLSLFTFFAFLFWIFWPALLVYSFFRIFIKL